MEEGGNEHRCRCKSMSSCCCCCFYDQTSVKRSKQLSESGSADGWKVDEHPYVDKTKLAKEKTASSDRPPHRFFGKLNFGRNVYIRWELIIMWNRRQKAAVKRDDSLAAVPPPQTHWLFLTFLSRNRHLRQLRCSSMKSKLSTRKQQKHANTEKRTALLCTPHIQRNFKPLNHRLINYSNTKRPQLV